MVGRDEPRARWDNEPIEVTRSEEQLHVEFDRVPFQRVRVVKYIVSEEVTRTVQVRREELRIEPEEIRNAEPIERWADRLTPDNPLELTLSEEQVVIETRVVPRERVRIWVEDVPLGDRVVEGRLRQERVEIIDPTLPPGTGADRLDEDSVDRPEAGGRGRGLDTSTLGGAARPRDLPSSDEQLRDAGGRTRY